MAIQIKAGNEVLGRLCDALGINPLKTPVRKIVIECDVESVLTAYVVCYGGEKVAEVLTEAFRVVPAADVTVDDCGNVTVK